MEKNKNQIENKILSISHIPRGIIMEEVVLPRKDGSSRISKQGYTRLQPQLYSECKKHCA